MSPALATAPRRMLNYKDAAGYLGISLRAAKELAAEGEIRKTKIGARVLFDIRDLDDFIDRQKRAS